MVSHLASWAGKAAGDQGGVCTQGSPRHARAVLGPALPADTFLEVKSSQGEVQGILDSQRWGGGTMVSKLDMPHFTPDAPPAPLL